MTKISKRTSFVEDQEGGITVLSLFFFLAMLMAAGLAVDINNLVQARTQLQGAADAAGHAALYWKWRNSESDAKAKAIEIASANMPNSVYGEVLAAADIEFGDYVPAKDGNPHYFDPAVPSYSAVRVRTRRTEGSSNGVGTFLMKFLGIDVLDVVAVSVWDYDEGWCPKGEGFFAVDVVDIQSGNNYQDGFCIHSDTHVEFAQNSTFQNGVVVSMPDENDIVLSSAGLKQNTGLEDAIDSINYNLATFFNDLPDLIDEYRDPLSEVNWPLTETQTNRVVLNNSEKLSMTHLVEGAVNLVRCGNNGVLTVASGEMLENVVIITSCEVKLGSSAVLENGTLISTNTSAKAIEAGSNVRVGDQTYCDSGERGANIITMGGFSTSSGFQAFGANVIAAGDISTTAAGSGLGGIKFMAGGRIDATSGGDFGFCSVGPPNPFRIPVFRMVM